MDSPLLSVTMSLNSFSEMEKNVYKFSKFIVSLDLRDNIVPVYVMVSRKQDAVLLDIVKITHPPLPPIWTTCTTYFERQKRRLKQHSK